MNPIISVIMSVYNAEKYLKEAIDSILNQTYKNFEFIIIDDGSTDKSLEIIENYSKKDNRIIIISRENRGLIYSLNEGIEKAKGEYIARMDADDISLPTRFEKQIELIEKDNIDICGCHYFIINENDKYIDTVIVPIVQESMLLNLAVNVPFAHGSVMCKKNIFDKFKYGETKYKSVEDYALWIKMYENKVKFGNVYDFLFKYREFNESFSKTKIKRMEQDRKNLSNNFIKNNKEKLTNTIDILLETDILSIWEENYLQMVSYRLKYRIIDVMKKVNKKSLIVGVFKYLKGIL